MQLEKRLVVTSCYLDILCCSNTNILLPYIKLPCRVEPLHSHLGTSCRKSQLFFFILFSSLKFSKCFASTGFKQWPLIRINSLWYDKVSLKLWLVLCGWCCFSSGGLQAVLLLLGVSFRGSYAQLECLHSTRLENQLESLIGKGQKSTSFFSITLCLYLT